MLISSRPPTHGCLCTICITGYACVYNNEYYSQCYPCGPGQQISVCPKLATPSASPTLSGPTKAPARKKGPTRPPTKTGPTSAPGGPTSVPVRVHLQENQYPN